MSLIERIKQLLNKKKKITPPDHDETSEPTPMDPGPITPIKPKPVTPVDPPINPPIEVEKKRSIKTSKE